MASWGKADAASSAPLWACHLVNLAPTASNRTNLFNWTVKLHNMSFPTKKRTNQQTFDHYMNIYQPKSKTGKRIISLAIVACVTVILTILLKYAF